MKEGSKFTPEQLEHLRQARRKQIRPPCSEAKKVKISQTLRAKAEELRPIWNFALAKAMTRFHDPDVAMKRSLGKIGNQNAKGYKHTEETKVKISQSLKQTFSNPEIRTKLGPRVNFWQGKIGPLRGVKGSAHPRFGKAPWSKGARYSRYPKCKHPRLEGHPLEFRILRETIRLRAGYKCQICQIPEKELPTKLHIHHLDGKINAEHNLVALCRKCHNGVTARGGLLCVSVT